MNRFRKNPICIYQNHIKIDKCASIFHLSPPYTLLCIWRLNDTVILMRPRDIRPVSQQMHKKICKGIGLVFADLIYIKNRYSVSMRQHIEILLLFYMTFISLSLVFSPFVMVIWIHSRYKKQQFQYNSKFSDEGYKNIYVKVILTERMIPQSYRDQYMYTHFVQ